MTTIPAAPTLPPTNVEPERAIATIVAAFTTDPILRWFYPDAERYLGTFPTGVTLMGGAAFASGTADCADDHVGVALWLPPSVEIDEQALGELIARTTDADRHPEVFSVLEQMGEHHPGEPCWYLPFIGVDPRCQGRGIGSQLLAAGLERCDRDGLPAYLEASSSRNRALYERHGFVVTGEIRAGDSPPLWPMLRTPR